MFDESPMSFKDYPREAVLTIRANPYATQLATLYEHFSRTKHIRSRTKLVEMAVRAFHSLYVVPYLTTKKEESNENTNGNETKA